MDTQTYGSVVAMEFRRCPGIDFADIVEEFDIAFQMADSRSRALIWDCDDIALIDRDCVRVALGWLPGTEQGQRSHLVVAVGANPDCGAHRVDPTSYRYLADRIVERSRGYLPFTAVLRGEAHQPVGAQLIDSTFDLLRMDTGNMHGDSRATGQAHAWADADPDAYADMVDAMAPHGPAGAQPDEAGERPDGDTSGQTNQLGQMLLARAEPTEPLRLTIHTLALSLCLYVPALGAAMFTYTMLRDVFPMATQAV